MFHAARRQAAVEKIQSTWAALAVVWQRLYEIIYVWIIDDTIAIQNLI